MITMTKFTKNNKTRKAFMISTSFIVILILALAVLGVGISLSYRFLKKAETMKAQLDAQTEAQIESYLKIIREKNIPLEVVIERLKLAMGKHVKELLGRIGGIQTQT